MKQLTRRELIPWITTKINSVCFFGREVWSVVSEISCWRFDIHDNNCFSESHVIFGSATTADRHGNVERSKWWRITNQMRDVDWATWLQVDLTNGWKTMINLSCMTKINKYRYFPHINMKQIGWRNLHSRRAASSRILAFLFQFKSNNLNSSVTQEIRLTEQSFALLYPSQWNVCKWSENMCDTNFMEFAYAYESCRWALPKYLRLVLGIIGHLQLLALRCRQCVTDMCMSVMKGHIS